MIILPSSIKILEKSKKKLLFEIEPLSPGYGVTIGNVLRRVLLSSIKGTAITSAKIKGVSHEFSALSGVKEELLEITLNLKQVKLKILGNEPQKIELKTSGEKKVTAKDIKTPSQVEIINKNLHIASLTSSKAKLEIEMNVQKGFGYITAEQLQKGESKTGIIYLDAIFTPIEKVAFWVENIRFEKRTDYNKLKMEIESDGTVLPEEALKKALKILIQHFEKMDVLFPKKKKDLSATSAQKKEKEKKIVLEDLKLSSKILNTLEENNIKTIAALIQKTKKNLEKIKGLGGKGIEKIEKKLKKEGLTINE